MSQYCKDLLNGLLQRDPVKRISFNDFFGHPFIDLEHMASEESLSKAVRCLLLIMHVPGIMSAYSFVAGVFS